MKEDLHALVSVAISMAIIAFFVGCAAKQEPSGNIASTTIAKAGTEISYDPTTANKTGSTTTMPKETTEDECYRLNMYWCAGKCQKEPCPDCGNIMRCVNVSRNGAVAAEIETAEPVAGKAGSCRYSSQYRPAGGEDGYCGVKKGTLIYARCGSSPTFEDCVKAYGGETSYTYEIAQQRAFHSVSGPDYDLWCFKCARAG